MSKQELLKESGFKRFIKAFMRNKTYLLMVLPGTVLMLIFNYLPMAGMPIAFKNFKNHPGSNIFGNFFKSEWVGFKNFSFLFSTSDGIKATGRTVGYNVVFIIAGLVCSVALAIALNEVINKNMKKFYQTTFLLPYFLSWVVVGYLVYAFLSPRTGVVNRVFLENMGIEGINWYADTRIWPFLFVFLNVWKNVGYNTVIYLAALTSIDQEYYEAASIDRANKWQQIRHITIPHLVPLMTILTILAVGRIFTGDFGLFYMTTSALGMGALKSVGNVLDTFVYDALFRMNSIGMSSAASFYQSVVGFIMVLGANLIVRKTDKENSLF